MTTQHPIDPHDTSWILTNAQDLAALDRGMLQLLDPATPAAALHVLFDTFADNSVHEHAYYHPNSTVSLRRHIREHWVRHGGEDAFSKSYPDPATATEHIEARWWRTREEISPGIRNSIDSGVEQAESDFASFKEFANKARDRRVQAFIEHILDKARADEEVTESNWEEESEGWLQYFTDLIRRYPASEVRDAIDHAVAEFGAEHGDRGAFSQLRGYLDGYVETIQNLAPVLPKPHVSDVNAYSAGHETGVTNALLAKGDQRTLDRTLDAILASFNAAAQSSEDQQRNAYVDRMVSQVEQLVRWAPEPRTRDLLYTAFASRGAVELPIVSWASGFIAGYLGDSMEVFEGMQLDDNFEGHQEGANYRVLLRQLNWASPSESQTD